MKKRIVLAVCFILVIFLLHPDIRADEYNQIQNTYDDAVKVVHFVPEGQRGIFNKGEVIRLDLALKASKSTEAAVDMTLIDFFNNKAGHQTLTIKLESGKLSRTKITFSPPAKFGHYTVETRISAKGKLCTRLQSAFSVLPPCPEKADPFFQMDGKNPHYMVDLTEEYHRMGVGSIQLALRGDSYKDAPLKAYNAKKPKYKFKTIHGYIGLSHTTPETKARLKAGKYPYSDEYYQNYLEKVRYFAETAGKDVSLWVIQQEADANAVQSGNSSLAELTNHVVMVKAITKLLRSITPNCKIAVVNSCGDDYFYNDFRYVRALLNETHKCFDIFAIDAYSGSWDGRLSPLAPPEPKFKELLLASKKIARTFNLPDAVINAERGCYVGYMDAFTAPNTKDQANFNTRSTIIARAVPNVLFYANHSGCAWYMPYNIKQSGKTPDKFNDNGLWRSVYDSENRFTLVPRPALNAFATVASQLAFVDDPHDVSLVPTVTGHHFRRPDGKRVLVLWSLKDPMRISLPLPVKSEIYDLMDNKTELQKGLNTFQLTQSPVFIVMEASVSDIDAMLKKADFPDIKTFDAFVRRTSPDTVALYLNSLNNKSTVLKLSCSSQTISVPAVRKLEKLQKIKINVKASNKNDEILSITDVSRTLAVKIPGTASACFIPRGKTPVKLLTVKYPDDVYPKAALRSERNLFRRDGSDITADMAASYDETNLYLEFIVNDRTHIQRQSGSWIWRDDCIQIAVDAGNNAFPGKSGYDQDDYFLGMALTEKSPVFYAWHNGRQSPGICNYKTLIIRKNMQTIYRTAIPWKNLSPLKPVPGTAFGFSFMVIDNNNVAFRDAPYYLALTKGIASFKEPYQFKTFILK